MKNSENGKKSDESEVRYIEIFGKNGIKVVISSLGATIVKICVPDKSGLIKDVVLGYDTPSDYEKSDSFFGALVGRVANRIAGAECVVNGKKYELEDNDNGATLHSGSPFYKDRMWDVDEKSENYVKFSLISPDMDQGFPGELKISVTYSVSDDNTLFIRYNAVSNKDTLVNMVNHSYFNLNGHDSGNVDEQLVRIYADYYTETGKGLIPTGRILCVDKTPLDLRQFTAVGKGVNASFPAIKLAGGYDHNFVIKDSDEYIKDIYGKKLRKASEAYSEKSGIGMETFTDMPGLQFYTGNFISNETGKDGAVYQKRAGMCFETQFFPDACHHENFVSTNLMAGENYDHSTAYHFYIK